MIKKRTILPLVVSIIAVLFMMNGVSRGTMSGTMVYSPNSAIGDTIYSASRYIEDIKLFPMKNTSVGIHAEFIGGETELPFDVKGYDGLEYFSLVFSNQRNWRQHSHRRFWDVPDGVSLVLQFKDVSQSEALTAAEEIEEALESIYGIHLALIQGERNAARRTTFLIYQGSVTVSDFDAFTTDFAGYISDEGFGAGITSSLLLDAPVKAMQVGIVHQDLFGGFGGGGGIEWVPVLSTAWVDPTGLETNGTVVDVSLNNIMPGLTPIEGADSAMISSVTMELPYIVDVQTIEPETDNLYPHFERYFEWIIKVDIPRWNWSVDNSYPDIHVVYDFNITNLVNYPKVTGELSISSDFPIMGGDDLTYTFTWENTGNETAYDINLSYGEFSEWDFEGYTLPVANPELTFDENKTMYWDIYEGLFTSEPLLGSYITIQGWFQWNNETWLADGETLSEEEFNNALELAYVNETFMNINPGDFTKTPVGEDQYSLTTTIASLEPGENVTKSFSIENLFNGTMSVYEGREINETAFQIYVNRTLDWAEIAVDHLSHVSTLHIPDDVKTGMEVAGSSFIYEDGSGKEYLGLTNGLVVQVYDDEAVLVGKVSLDRDVYRFNDLVTFTVDLENIGDADATDIELTLYHAFVTENFNIRYVEAINGSYTTIDKIAAGESYSFNLTHPAKSHIGLHPVFATFGYTSNETVDPEHPIFSSCRHETVFSSMDFGIVLPPREKEGKPKPTYPTPEVEVVTAFVENTTNTTVGDVLTLRTEITNVGDEPTNIIYFQHLPETLSPASSEDEINITVGGAPITDFSVIWMPNPKIGMPLIVIASKFNQQGAWGIPLGVNETMVIEAQVEVVAEGEIFIPPTQVRYRSNYTMTDPGSPERGEGEGQSSAFIFNDLMSSSSSGSITPVSSISMTAEEEINERATTNSWGSYSESLLIVAKSLGGGGGDNGGFNYVLIGLGLIAVTGVAVLIYFRANGKKNKK
ncbi:MAG: hypothetical protein GF308_02650 [Candidatus Heimdallarchaeota archaeon]|nr:hypothetical protein [Candidatus Heimdallarchaeota archaeon]